MHGALGSQLKLHIIVFILGFTAILGKLINLPAVNIVCYRTLIAFFCLFIILKFKKISLRIPFGSILMISSIGVIVALHWISFFYAIKVSNISVTLGCLSTSTLFTSIIEPLTQKRRIKWYEVMLGIIIIAGLYIIFQFETKYAEGIIFSVIAALLASTFSVLNKNISRRFDNNVITFYEMLSGFIVIIVYLFISEGYADAFMPITALDALWLFILGFVCTAWAFSATVELMKKISAYIIVLSINLEPVYGIIMAFLIFGESERMTLGFYIGTVIILLSVFSYPLLSRKFSPDKA
jgi:drug/metabolite transporter (DMT)-like permease